MRTFFEEYGFVVIRDAIDQQHVQSIKSHIFELASTRAGKKIDPDNLMATDWVQVYAGEYNAKRGFLACDIPVSQPATDARQHPNIYRAFSALSRRKDLWTKFDRYGLMRPTRNVKNLEGEYVDVASWKTESNWCHWDQNPWDEPHFARMQTILAVSDHTETSGGFHCIPGMHKGMNKYAEVYSDRWKRGCLVSMEDPELLECLYRVTLRKGNVADLTIC
eukprot:TRINITY_DN4527_c0_g1_i1.p1 TRINITY_DN4527_c0_g1~~TRINITY_DN4527_c0_g1_i1.p1  ORF type:complete len:257 (+),score=45.77 TRINITY_DN4527_c0_g1_i1:112-771(+)